jgi:alkylation response protein AidB-like acyl-CoA dehydrogenase
VRDFVEREIRPYALQWNEQKDYPDELLTKAYAAGLYAYMWPEDVGGTPIRDSKGNKVQFDYFHDLIAVDEFARGPAPPPFGIVTMGLPPVLKLGSQRIKDMVLPDVVTGKKQIALCISEPWAGSDVANIKTTATKDSSGKFYIVNGEKKYITCGMKAKFFTVAVRTGDQGMFGISLLLVDAESKGISRRAMKTQV